MALTADTIQSIFDAMQTHVAKSGHFEKVNTHEPKKAPGSGLSAAIWIDHHGPQPGESALDKTTWRLVFNVRIYTNFISEPQDAIDPMMLTATSALMEAYSGDFTLGGIVKNIDLLGAGGVPLQAQAGYMNQDNQMLRISTITVPVVVNDAYTQAP